MPDKDAVMISMGADEFSKKVTPKKISEAGDLFFFQCQCDNVHFRHGGYVEVLVPFMRADKTKNVSKDSLQVMICTKCHTCYVWLNEQMYDVTELIDIEAWEKTERELQKATGPGGNC